MIDHANQRDRHAALRGEARRPISPDAAGPGQPAAGLYPIYPEIPGLDQHPALPAPMMAIRPTKTCGAVMAWA